MENSDADLLDQYRKGDVEAFGRLVEQYKGALFGFILNMTGKHEQADEVFQEVWLKAIKNIDKYKNNKFLGWLFMIARNCIIDRSRVKRMTSSLEQENEYGLSMMDVIPGGEVSPSDDMGNRETGARIYEAVAALPFEQREVFLMRMEGDMAFKDIARVQGVSINTALARMQYALEKLRNDLKDEYRSWGRWV